MSLTPAMIDAMVATGVTAEQLAAVVKADMAEREKQAKARRAKDAERQRLSRDNRARHTMSRDVTVTGCDIADAPLSPSPLSSPQTPQQTPHPHTPEYNTPRAMADGWLPAQFGPRTQSRAIVDGWPPGELAAQVEHFVAHHRSRGSKFKDWQDAWSTWVLNSRKFGARHAKPTNSRNTGSPTLNAVQRAIQLTGGSTRGSGDGSRGGDGRIGAMPDPVRSIGHERG